MQLKAWVMAARPRTLPVSLAPIIVGTVLAIGQTEHLPWGLSVWALLCSLWIQIGTNLVNDALDFKKGADGPGRLGPQRVTQGGLLTFDQVLRGGCICFALALVSGIPLMLAGGWPLALLLVLSVCCGYLYTGGPYPLAYLGFSDLFVLIFFGWGSTCAVYYLLTGTVSFLSFFAATQIGLLAMVPHAINNLRDHVSDARVNKRTIAVRFGPEIARCEITALSLLPYLLGMGWFADGYAWMALLPFLSLPLTITNVLGLWNNEPSPLFNQYLAKSALCQLIFSCLLAFGYLLG